MDPVLLGIMHTLTQTQTITQTQIRIAPVIGDVVHTPDHRLHLLRAALGRRPQTQTQTVTGLAVRHEI